VPVPKISAPTLVEHRNRQHAALLDAARQIAMSEGHQAVTFAAVAARAGLARNSVYEYFDSPRDLLGALMLEHMRRWILQVRAAVAAASTPEEKITAYVDAGLRHMVHEEPLARSLAEMPIPDRDGETMVSLIASMLSVLAAAVRARGVTNADATATYIQGSMRAAVRRIDAGYADLDSEIFMVQQFALASTTPPPATATATAEAAAATATAEAAARD
jgi:AcrR family transcriptional regulator